MTWVYVLIQDSATGQEIPYFVPMNAKMAEIKLETPSKRGQKWQP
jgi:hypothetical protein